jgi:hypothetical protein
MYAMDGALSDAAAIPAAPPERRTFLPRVPLEEKGERNDAAIVRIADRSIAVRERSREANG